MPEPASWRYEARRGIWFMTEKFAADLPVLTGQPVPGARALALFPLPEHFSNAQRCRCVSVAEVA